MKLSTLYIFVHLQVRAGDSYWAILALLLLRGCRTNKKKFLRTIFIEKVSFELSTYVGQYQVHGSSN